MTSPDLSGVSVGALGSTKPALYQLTLLNQQQDHRACCVPPQVWNRRMADRSCRLPGQRLIVNLIEGAKHWGREGKDLTSIVQDRAELPLTG